MSFYPIGTYPNISSEMLKALEREDSDFSGKKLGAYQIIAEKDRISIRKIQNAVGESKALEPAADTVLLKGAKLDKAIDSIAEALEGEVAKIQTVVLESCFAGKKSAIESFEICSVQDSSLAQLKEIAEDEGTKSRIEALEKKLVELKQIIGKPHDFILKEALVKGDLDLAHWAVHHGATPALLDSKDIKITLKPEAIAWLKLVSQKLPKTPQNLDHYALKIGLGYKTANLELMEANLQKAAKDLKVCEVDVPRLKGISDFEMSEFLKAAIPNFDEKWNEFLNTFEKPDRDAFCEAKGADQAKKVPIKISPKGEQILREIRELVEKQFTGPKPYSSLLLQEWLKKVNPQYVIVRSTGKEDSDVAANAGGNESTPFVNPNEKDISKSIGGVLASYYGVKSLTQRLQSGDQTVFTEKPFLPVLIQEMICEPNLAGVGSTTFDIPRSGVLFTSQRGRSEDVVVINAALGSNEGVVSSQVVVDTYAVHPKGVYKIIRDKESRFVQARNPSSLKIQVGPIANSSNGLRKPPALTDGIAQDLASLSTAYGRMYGDGKVKPMDMEYTILFRDLKIAGSEKTKKVPVIYPLQIRPLLSTKELKPTFLKLDEVRNIKKEHQVPASTLLSGNCSTAVITNPSEQVIFADDLPQALSKYQKLRDVSNIRLIITRKSAPLTSHEAVTLSQTDIPVMTVAEADNYLAVKRCMDKATAKTPCYADPQRALIIYGEGKKEEALIGEGLVSYPGPREYSLPLKPRGSSCLKEGLDAPRRTEALLKLYESSSKLSNEILKNPEDFNRLKNLSITELLDKIAMSDKEEAKKALAVLNRRLLLQFIDKNKAEIKKQLIEGNPQNADDFLKVTVQIYEEIFHLIQQDLLPALDYPAQSMKRLFYLKPIEALIFQEGTSAVLNSFSFRNVLTTTKGISELSRIHDKFQFPRDHNNIWLVAIGKSGYQSEVRNNWYQFISRLNEGQKQELIDKIRMLQKLDMTEPFINILFSETWNQNPRNPERVFSEIMSVLGMESATYTWLLEQQVVLKTIEGQTGNWGVPSFAEKNIPKMKGKLESLGFIGKTDYDIPEILERYNSASPFAKLAILLYARRTVTSYDSSIKGLTGSTLFESDKQKALSFGEMLKPYNQMMETLMRMIDRTDRYRLMQNSEEEVKISYEDYQIGLKKGLNYAHGDLFKDIHNISPDMQSSVVSNGHWVHPQIGRMEKYFTSPGFLELTQSLSGDSEKDAAFQFEARSGFNVDNFIIGSKLDRDYAVHWPARLEEYFTTFHQTMEKVIKHELTKNGMDLRIIPKNLQAACEMFNRIFDISPSTISKSGEMLEISYDVPLRQHAAKVTFKMNAHKSDTPITMEIKTSGIEESDRWKRTAVIAALMSHKLGLPFESGVPPQIYYSDPSQVSFSLQIPRGYPKMEEFLKKCLVMIKTNTMADPAHSRDLKFPEAAYEAMVVRGEGKQFKDLFGISSLDDWKHVPGQFFSDSLYLNLYLLDHFTKSADIPTVMKIIDYTIQGLQQYGQKDYAAGYISRFNADQTHSLVGGMKGCLTHLITEITAQQVTNTLKLGKLQIAPVDMAAEKKDQVDVPSTKPVPNLEEVKIQAELKKLEEQKRALEVLLAKISTV